MKKIKSAIIIAGALAVVTCFDGRGAQAADSSEVVAEVNGYKVYQSDLDRERRQLPPQSRSYPKHVIDNFLINSLVNSYLVASEARKTGIEKEESIKRMIARFENQVLEQEYYKRHMAEQVTDAKLQVAYQELVKNNPTSEEARARHILVETEEQAMEVIARLKKGDDFATLAKSVSTGPSGKSGGDLGYFTREKMVPPFSEAAFATKPGEFTTKPVRTQFGWHIIKVEDRRMTKPPAFEEAKTDLLRSVAQKIKGEYIEELRKKADLKINLKTAGN